VPFKSGLKNTALALTADFTPLQSTMTKEIRKSHDEGAGVSEIKSFDIDEKKISNHIEEDKKSCRGDRLQEDTDK
jgi:hypothetical protein